MAFLRRNMAFLSVFEAKIGVFECFWCYLGEKLCF
jgi:hypothetical protein